MVTRRKAIPASVREEVVRTYGRACWLRFPDCTESRDMTLDHLYPDRLGGSDTVRNLRPACRHCNSARHDRLVQGRGITVTVHLASPYELDSHAPAGAVVLDWRIMYGSLSVRSDMSWPVMEGMWRGAVFEALRQPSAVRLWLAPPPDTTADQVREWIRLGYRIERGDGHGVMGEPSCELEARAWNTWRRNRLGVESLERLESARDLDWRHYELVF